MPEKVRSRNLARWLIVAGVAAVAGVLAIAWFVEPFTPRYDASYVGSDECGRCHTGIHAEWKGSSHRKMTRRPNAESVVGNFDDAEWLLPASARRQPGDDKPAARMYSRGDKYFMALRHPHEDRFIPFEVAYVVGFQYRQVYLTKEKGGVLRRLPLQWSVPRGEYFPYWNMQERSVPSVRDLWAQMTSQNSAWNLFCARCHTTNLRIVSKNPQHTMAETEWLEPGIACEACHGPGSQHVEYFKTNYANRLFGFLEAGVRGRRAPYIASASKLEKGPSMSVCARCHGSDILMSATDVFRTYEPGFSRKGKTNDLSPYFQQTPLVPNRRTPTTEVYANGRPKGIGMLFRSMIESRCYQEAEVRCHDCHDPHNNKKGRTTEVLKPSADSDAYCLRCHDQIGQNIEAHTRHEPGTEGARCYDCHMPKSIVKIAAGVEDFTRTHEISSIPRPADTVRWGARGAPNACNMCHADESAAWALEHVQDWYGQKTEVPTSIRD